jgi:hypothetical protein
MGKRHTQIAVIVITLFILLFPAYLRCSNLAEANLFSTDLSFENPDQDDQFVDQQNESKAFALSVFPIICLPGINLSKQLPRFSFQTASFDQKLFVLRC